MLFRSLNRAKRWVAEMLGKGWELSDRGTPRKVLKAEVLTLSRPGEPDRFAEIKDSDLYALHDAINKRAVAANKNGDTALAAKYESWIEQIQDMIALARNGKQDRLRKYAQGLPAELRSILPKSLFSKTHASRFGKPERFDRYGYEKMDTDSLLYNERYYLMIQWQKDKSANRGTGRVTPATRAKVIALKDELERRGHKGGVLAELLREPFSRPGKPDTFDASSLERGDFKDASTSPMLGKLLSEKAMPDGGWRAVQVGSDTLVISFEDADLARDFGRRASTKGYSATSPVATTGRYWNVEVKNGK